jgi:hypothetical protein
MGGAVSVSDWSAPYVPLCSGSGGAGCSLAHVGRTQQHVGGNAGMCACVCMHHTTWVYQVFVDFGCIYVSVKLTACSTFRNTHTHTHPLTHSQIRMRTHTRAQCFVGIDSSPDTTCDIAGFYMGMYMFFNLGYNILIILILKYGSSNLLWLAMTIVVPMSNIAFRCVYVRVCVCVWCMSVRITTSRRI